MIVIDWDIYPDFTEKEFSCTATGLCFMRHELIDILQSIRSQTKKPMFISSGYRDSSHPIEAMKDKPGEHATGMAADIICHGVQALEYLKLAQALGVTRIGLHQKGRVSGRFIHVGVADKYTKDFTSATWTY